MQLRQWVAEEMTKAKFKIGKTEKHLIVVDMDRFMKHITIELDGKMLANEFHYSPLAKKFQFDVEVPKSIGWRSALDLLTYQTHRRWESCSRGLNSLRRDTRTS